MTIEEALKAIREMDVICPLCQKVIRGKRLERHLKKLHALSYVQVGEFLEKKGRY